MLQFLKKPGRRPHSICDPSVPGTSSLDTPSRDDRLEQLHSIESECLQGVDADDSSTRSSRLFLGLLDILRDQDCLCYFLQFMEAQQAVPLLKFWLAVENFRMSAEDDDKLLEEKSKCDIIEDRPLTDDEKTEMKLDQGIKKQKLRRHNSQFQTTVATDALKIYEKFLCANSDSWIDDIPATVHSRISLSMGHSTVSAHCFSEAQQLVEERLEKEFLRRFLDSGFYCKYCLEILTGGDVRLADILYSECALFYFMEFLEQQEDGGQRDFLDFWVSATNFRKHSNSASASSDAMVLYDKYFSLQATNPLGLCNAVRSRVEERICATEENLLIGCFDLPIRIVERFFGEFYLQKFLASELFYKHVSDLLQRSQVAEGRQPHRVLRTQSVSVKRQRKGSGEIAGGSLRRTLSSVSMSEGGSVPPQVAKLGSTVELRIDTRALGCSGGEKRTNGVSSLSFGRVDSLGRFERDFEWRDEGGTTASAGSALCEESAGAKLKRAVKRLVHMSEDKVQEELAWQVAEMIVKDVTDITMNGGGDGRKSGIVVVGEEDEDEDT